MTGDSAVLSSLGFELPSLAYIIGSIFFGIVGYFIYRQGRKSGNLYVFVIGIGLNVFTFFVDSTWLMYLIGCAMCASAWFAYRYPPH